MATSRVPGDAPADVDRGGGAGAGQHHGAAGGSRFKRVMADLDAVDGGQPRVVAMARSDPAPVPAAATAAQMTTPPARAAELVIGSQIVPEIDGRIYRRPGTRVSECAAFRVQNAARSRDWMK